MSKFWLLEQDAEIFDQLGRRLMRDGSLGVKNTRKIYEAEQKFSNAQRVFSDDHILPPDFPVPMLSMPDDGFAPDYFSIEMFKFCSKRFRESLDQPDSVVQYMSINLLGGGTMVQGQDYQWMRVIAQQPAIDLQKSLCTVKELTNRFTGAPFKLASFIERYAARQSTPKNRDFPHAGKSDPHSRYRRVSPPRVESRLCRHRVFRSRQRTASQRSPISHGNRHRHISLWLLRG